MTPLATTIITALITGGLALLGTIISVMAGTSKTRNEMKTEQAVTNEKIHNLAEEVRKHNNFASIIPKLEEHMEVYEKEVNRRLQDLERKVDEKQ